MKERIAIIVSRYYIYLFTKWNTEVYNEMIFRVPDLTLSSFSF